MLALMFTPSIFRTPLFLLRPSQEPMRDVIGVHDISCNCILNIDGARDRPLKFTAVCAGRIEGGNVAALGAQEAVTDAAGVHVLSNNVPWGVDGRGVGSLEGASARTGKVH